MSVADQHSPHPNAAGDGLPVSFEFFPPNTPEGHDKLKGVCEKLAAVKPEYFSVTFGAGGSTREKTLAVVMDIAQAGHQVAPHLSCVGATRQSITELLDTYKAAGVKRLVALRGDQPSGMVTHGDFHYANELVSFVRQNFGQWFHIEVACYPEVHPQARTPGDDLHAFVRKVQAGADAAITQYFYNADAYFRFVDEARAAGVKVPIVPGIMPITNYTQLARFSQTCGAEIPRWIDARLRSYGDDRNAIRAFGAEVVTKLCEQLRSGGAPSLHFYTLNQALPSLEVIANLRA
jgi:methylenetetrahydrofolate reductase (NADPH)